MTAKETKAEAAARRERARADAEWLRRLAEKAEATLGARARRPAPPSGRPTSEERRAERASARADAAWLRELAERGKAELERRKAQGDSV